MFSNTLCFMLSDKKAVLCLQRGQAEDMVRGGAEGGMMLAFAAITIS